MATIKDFTKGQTVYIENITQSRKRNPVFENCYRVATVDSVGRKYVTVDRKKFEEFDSYEGLPEHSDFSVLEVLYPSLEEFKKKFEKEQGYYAIRERFEKSVSTFEYDEIMAIKKILNL